ncbi:30S ribosomal protein S16 [Candidatus Photodesmus katoptron]|uniref:Small ribosomal subunit protein bS16 n=1 Tax=Candidatus Photodesmus katoptron Akat1 TaxID=1236703 RepID=S3EI47_9GAMM|nr:30S ribosomal protein S16 [Candidatus Photodesmus katoptron]EPE37848.1 ribosomal protein S16 [Candidatus Photodesmus katoptron Akat1]KEY90433.1 30S ribosomal protein S16 [Candidatus Photodesmus katoptron]
MVTIRLARHGAKKRPFYQVVVAVASRATTGKFIEKVGFFNPINQDKRKNLFLKTLRINHWISKGASVSTRVTKLIKDFEKITKD